MKDALGKLLKVVNFLWKVLPILLDALQDLADDGAINGSTGTRRRANKSADEETK